MAAVSSSTGTEFKVNRRPKDDFSDDDDESNRNEKMQRLDASLLNEDGTECQTAKDSESVIVHCQYLKRLVVALRLFEANKDDDVRLERLLVRNYGRQLLDDFGHFLEVHSAHSAEIKAEMIRSHGFTECNVENCEFTERHFSANRRDPISSASEDGNERDPALQLYRDEYDSLHFNLWHLFHSGYRLKEEERTGDDEGDGDHDFGEMVNSVRANRDKYNAIFGRFQTEGENKYVINAEDQAAMIQRDHIKWNEQRYSFQFS